MEAQRGKLTCPKAHSKWQRLERGPGGVDQGPAQATSDPLTILFLIIRQVKEFLAPNLTLVSLKDMLLHCPSQILPLH